MQKENSKRTEIRSEQAESSKRTGGRVTPFEFPADTKPNANAKGSTAVTEPTPPQGMTADTEGMTAVDSAERFIRRRTKDQKRDYEVALDNLSSAKAFVKAEWEKVTRLKNEVIPELVSRYNEAISTGRKIAALQTKREKAEKELEFAQGWLTKKNVNTNPNLAPKYEPSESDKTIETATKARDKTKSIYVAAMQSAYMKRMDLLCERASDGMKILFEAYTDKDKIDSRCAAILSGFRSPVPNPVQVSGFIATIYRDAGAKVRYQRMCSLFPAAVLAGKHAFESMLRADRAKALEEHDRQYRNEVKEYVLKAVELFRDNNPDADFKSEQMKKNIRDLEAVTKAQYFIEHPKELFIYTPPFYEPVAEEGKPRTAYDIQEEIEKVAIKARAKADADVAAGIIPEQKKSNRSVVELGKTNKPKKASPVTSPPIDGDEFARGFTQADMMN